MSIWAFLPGWPPFAHAFRGMPEGPGAAQLSLCGTVEWLWGEAMSGGTDPGGTDPRCRECVAAM